MFGQLAKHYDTTLKRIILIVLCAHILAILLTFFQFQKPPVAIKKEVLIVKTIELGAAASSTREVKKAEVKKKVEEPKVEVEEKQPEVKKEIKKEAPKPVEEVKKEVKVEEKKPTPVLKKETATVVKKEVVPKKSAEKKTTVKKAEVKKKAPEKAAVKTPKKKEAAPPPIDNLKQEIAKKAKIEKQQALLKTARESMAKIDKNAVVASGKSTSIPFRKPGKIEKLQIEALPVGGSKAVFTDRESSYQEELASRLKLFLRLPDYGEVKVKLTLERSGKVSAVAIVSSQSDANRKYIEKTLPGLSFPGFGDNFSGHSQYTFQVSLSNE